MFEPDADGVVRRERVDHVDAETFERFEARIADGLDWGVGALAERDGAVLLVRQDGRWLLPGGGVEPGESREAGLVREVAEETGLDATVGDLRAVTRVTYRHGDRSCAFRFGIYDAAVTGTLTDDPGKADEAITDAGWFEAFPEDTLDRELLRFLRDER